MLKASESAAVAALSLSSTAEAQDLDLDSTEKRKTNQEVKSVEFERDVREFERGMYSKANVGATIFVLDHRSPFTAPVNSVALSFGDDFVDRESLSMAWEVSFQTVHNGLSYTEQSGVLPDHLFKATLGCSDGSVRSVKVSNSTTRHRFPCHRRSYGYARSDGPNIL